jgi:branched-chain amino acid transport system permease protein
MISWLDAIIQGLLLGGLYALFAAGLAIAFGVMRLVNVAHGDLIVLAAFLAAGVSAALGGLSPFLALVLVVPIMAGIGYALQLVLFNRVLGQDLLRPVIVTFGLSLIIQNGLLQGFSADTRRLHAGAVETMSLQLGGGLAVGIVPLATLATAIAVIGLLQLFFYRTSLGRAFRAVADDPEAARLVGIDPLHLFGLAMAVAMGIVAIGGVFMGLETGFGPAAGPSRLLFAFEAVIMGGLGSLWGTLAGGLMLGVAQTVGARIDPEWQILAGHLAFLALLLVRPRGLFPMRSER